MKLALKCCGLVLTLCFVGCGDDGETTDATDMDPEPTDTDSADTDPTDTDSADTDPTDTDPTDAVTDGETDDESVTLMGEDGESVEITFTGEGPSCGSETCSDAKIGGTIFTVPGCCSDAEEEICGFDMRTFGVLLGLQDPGCEPLAEPAASDPDCPESDPLTITLGTTPSEVVMSGCCQDNGQCGFAADFGSFGFGCVDPARFDQSATGECNP